MINKNKFLQILMLLLTCSVIFSCTACMKSNTKSVDLLYKENFTEQHYDKLNNFIFLSSVRAIEGVSIVSESAASGFVVEVSDSHIFIMTANHFCEPEKYYKDEFANAISKLGNRVITGYNGPFSRDLMVVSTDESYDLCLLTGLKRKDENYNEPVFADNMPKIGERVYNVAAPSSIAGPDVSLLFDGYFGGCETFFHCSFTIPATFGSSGSAIYNENGEIVSVLVAVPEDFRHVGFGPDVHSLKNLIKDLKNNVDVGE